jgi:RNA polymerase sigma factor (sigma-70 family)
MSFDPDDSKDITQGLLTIARRMARRWCATDADADDAAQEAIVRLWSSRTPPRNPITWLAVVTRRLCNRERVQQAIRSRAEEAFAASGAPAQAALHDLLIDLDRIAGSLTERDRHLLRFMVAGHQTSEIAEALDCSAQDVGQMVSRVRSKARRLRDNLRSASENSGGVTPPRGPNPTNEGRCSHPIRNRSGSRK